MRVGELLSLDGKEKVNPFIKKQMKWRIGCHKNLFKKYKMSRKQTENKTL